MKTPLFQPAPGAYWPVVRWHLLTVYMSCIVWAVIRCLEWLL